MAEKKELLNQVQRLVSYRELISRKKNPELSNMYNQGLADIKLDIIASNAIDTPVKASEVLTKLNTLLNKVEKAL